MLANRLKELREKNGLTQEQVANYLGVDQSLITRIEKGERNIQVSHLEALSSLYGCDLVNEDTDPIVIKYRAKEINDNDLKNDLHAAVGDGNIDWKAFETEFQKYKIDASVLVEVSGLEKQKKSLEYLKRRMLWHYRMI